MIKINKTHSKNDLFDLINLVNIPIVFSHSDNKQDLHDKINDILKEPFEIKPNHFGITNIDNLKEFLINQDPFFANDKFIPLISPQVKRVLEAKLLTKSVRMNCLKIRRGTPECPVIVVFD